MSIFWTAIGAIVSVTMGADVVRNPQSYRDVWLRIKDGLAPRESWPKRLVNAHMYPARHRLGDPLPSFMRSWQPPRRQG
jgi:hypothetical protein